jgi:hypothetical protein
MKAPFWFVEAGSKYRLLEHGEDTGVTYASFEKAKADVSARNNAWRSSQAPRAKRSTKKRNPDRIPGGKADDVAIGFFDPKRLAKGIRHELEHTSDPQIASEIARDHLFEDPDYYEKLDYMERTYPPGKAFRPNRGARRVANPR